LEEILAQEHATPTTSMASLWHQTNTRNSRCHHFMYRELQHSFTHILESHISIAYSSILLRNFICQVPRLKKWLNI